MKILNTEVVLGARTGDYALAEHYIPLLEDWAARLQVGIYLREGELTEYMRMKVHVYRQKLELLEHSLAGGVTEEIQDHSQEVSLAFLRMERAYENAR